MSDEIQVSIEINGKRITLSGPEDFVRGEVRHLAGLLTRSVQDTAPSSSRPQQEPSPAPPADGEKDLIEEKKPRSQTETVAVLAFALTQSGRKEFTEDDMRRAYIRAGVRPPHSVGQALRDAKSKCDFVASGSKRGTYRLSDHGERAVRFDLPKTDG